MQFPQISQPIILFLEAKGNDIIKLQRFSKVKTTATEQNLLDVSLEIEKLLGKTLNEVVREDESGITSV